MGQSKRNRGRSPACPDPKIRTCLKQFCLAMEEGTLGQQCSAVYSAQQLVWCPAAEVCDRLCTDACAPPVTSTGKDAELQLLSHHGRRGRDQFFHVALLSWAC